LFFLQILFFFSCLIVGFSSMVFGAFLDLLGTVWDLGFRHTWKRVCMEFFVFIFLTIFNSIFDSSECGSVLRDDDREDHCDYKPSI
jgi:hypothetical protein